LQLTFEIEDSMREIVEAPGSMAQIEQAVLRKVLELRDAYYERQSRQRVMSRGFIGVGTEKSS
jgi:uncharacterized tellurite resistance protein B-like protein